MNNNQFIQYSNSVDGDHKRMIVTGGFWAFFGKAIYSFSSFLITILISRLLSPDEAGIYFLIISVLNAGIILGLFGLNQTIVREVASSIANNDPIHARIAISKSLIIGVFSATIFGLLISLIFTYLIVYDKSRLLINRGELNLIVIWILILVLQILIAESFRGYHNIRMASLVGRSLGSFITVIIYLIYFIISKETNLSLLVSSAIIADFLILLFAIFILRKEMLGFLFKGEPSSLNLIRASLPILIISTLTIFLVEANIWILGIVRSVDEVALFSISARIIHLMLVPLLLVSSVLSPMIAEMYTLGKIKNLERILRMTATIMVIPAIILFTFIVGFGKEFLSIFYGKYYTQAYPILLILSLGQIINVFTGSSDLTLIMTGRQKITMLVTIITGVITIGASLLSVGKYGTIGVAWSVALGLILFNVSLWLIVKKLVGLWTHASFNEFILLFKKGKSEIMHTLYAPHNE